MCGFVFKSISYLGMLYFWVMGLITYVGVFFFIFFSRKKLLFPIGLEDFLNILFVLGLWVFADINFDEAICRL